MTAREMKRSLAARPPGPFRMMMNDGQTLNARHPELVLLMETGEIYVFDSARSDEFRLGGLPGVRAVRKITTLELLPQDGSSN